MNHQRRSFTAAAILSVVLLVVGALPLSAQSAARGSGSLLGQLTEVPPPASEDRSFRSLQDSLDWVSARERARSATGRRLMIDLFERRLFWMNGADTLFVAPVAVGSGDTLSYRNNQWEFTTPRGRRVVRAKEENPTWVPPLWHYVRHARATGRELTHLQAGRAVSLSDGTRLIVRGNRVGRVATDGSFHPVDRGDHIIFDNTVFVPPLGTLDRQISDELGRYKLDLGDAYLIHGTPHKASIGEAVTHGCIRVGDDDLEFIYRYIPVGTPVYIY
ncbi:hypothetical protein BH23GEM6_BH23GEM6_22000 [soil metagenome]